MTTSNSIRHNSGFIKTNGLISDYPRQRVIFSAYSKNYPNILQGRLNSFYYNNKLNEFNNFGGMLLRLNLTANHTISNNILFQLSPNNADIIKLEQKEKIINIKCEDSVVTEYKIGHEEYVDSELLIEIGKISNNELFKIYERDNNFDILMTKLEINHKNYKEVEDF
jgi:hypothetical protein